MHEVIWLTDLLNTVKKINLLHELAVYYYFLYNTFSTGVTNTQSFQIYGKQKFCSWIGSFLVFSRWKVRKNLPGNFWLLAFISNPQFHIMLNLQLLDTEALIRDKRAFTFLPSIDPSVESTEEKCKIFQGNKAVKQQLIVKPSKYFHSPASLRI